MSLFGRNTDRDWEEWGQKDPYFGVITDPRFLTSNLVESSFREFFSSGEIHAAHIIAMIRSRIRSDFNPDRILDYGCGVGRLVIPFCQHANTVVGVDVSKSMLDEARRNCQKHGAESVQLLPVEEFWALPPSSFDFIHSYIVFQHIPIRRGEQIIAKLVSLLVDGGIGAIHVTFSNDRNVVRNFISGMRTHSSLLNGFLNLARGHAFGQPAMQMNRYSLNRIFDILMKAQCSRLTIEFSDHDGHRGAMLYFQKRPAPLI